MEPETPKPENQNPETENTEVPVTTAAPKTEDELFKSANQDMELEQAPPPQPVQAKKRSKKPLVIFLVLLLIAAGAAAAWYFFMQKSDAPVTQQQGPAVSEEVELTYEPNTIAYAFREASSSPFVLYTRPAEGGDRVEIQKLTRDSFISSSDVVGPNVAFTDDNVIYVSTDHGETYLKAFEGEAGSQITSLKLDNEGTGLAFGYLKDQGKQKNELRTIDLSGKNPKTLLTSESAGVFIYGWSSKAKRIIYQVGCYNCDGRRQEVYTFGTDTEKSTRILDGVATNDIVSLDVSSDTSLLIYVSGDYKDDGEVGGVNVAPYEVKLLKVSDNVETEVTRVGNAGQKNTNGTDKIQNFITGFVAGLNTPYYATGGQLFLVKDNEGLLFYESDKDIIKAHYVSNSNVIASSGETSDFALTNYDVSTKKSTSILLGDNNTNIFGVTTD